MLVLTEQVAAVSQDAPRSRMLGYLTATGVLTAPVVLALASGLTSVLGRRSKVSDGFGLLGLASAGPIIVILLLAIALY